MNLTFTTEQEDFRNQVRQFVRDNLLNKGFKVESKGLIADSDVSFSKAMSEKGWIGFTWPKSHWGQGRSYVEKTIMNEELYRVQAPIGYHFLADRQVGPSLIHFGSDWQRSFFLPRIVTAEKGMMFCLLFSEPDAGSDLAGIATTARKDGDYYIINGQKVWSSEAHLADYGWLLAKTNLDAGVSAHNACSEFILDMNLPGVKVRPLINIAGEHSFNEVFLDNVRVHKDYLVGTEHNGFRQIMAQVDYERAGIERLMQNYPVYDQLFDYMKVKQFQTRKPELYAWAKDQLARLTVEFETGRLLCYYTAWMIDQGKKPTSQAALCKVFCTQYEQRLNDMAMRILGPMSMIRKNGSNAPLDVDVAACYLWQPSYTLQGGSVEILKNIVALRGLKLPRD
ncbi:acyl-CoA dehydrogenase family protein [Desulfosarcina sp. OttesenSCG-928-A07]|nr:acyl-CoA dehydrogenase family protein [Desulfosarcina sp. OttesenSCG-928-G17]MDL2328979.1 acyl-CoA dehydrogenase family protein [Desulfosarcina sp. OttesenSCG-928-A07]